MILAWASPFKRYTKTKLPYFLFRTYMSKITSYGHVRSQNKITDFFFILAWLCRFNLLNFRSPV